MEGQQPIRALGPDAGRWRPLQTRHLSAGPERGRHDAHQGAQRDAPREVRRPREVAGADTPHHRPGELWVVVGPLVHR